MNPSKARAPVPMGDASFLPPPLLVEPNLRIGYYAFNIGTILFDDDDRR